MDSYDNFMRRQAERLQQERSAQSEEEARERGRRLRVAQSMETTPPTGDQLVVRGRATKESTQEGLRRDMEEQRTNIKFDLLRAELAVAFKKEKNPGRLVKLAMDGMTPAEDASLRSMQAWQIEVFAAQLAATTREEDEARLEHISSLVKRAFDPGKEERNDQMGAK